MLKENFENKATKPPKLALPKLKTKRKWSTKVEIIDKSGTSSRESAKNSFRRNSRCNQEPQLFTPRRQYAEEKKHKTSFSYSLILKLKDYQLDQLRALWSKTDNLTLYEFVGVLKKWVVLNEADDCSGYLLEEDPDVCLTTSALVEIFNEIDVNSNKRVSWNEFTEYLVDIAGSQMYNADCGPNLRFVDTHKRSSGHDNDVVWCQYFQGIGIVIFEHNMHFFKIYDSDFKLKRVVHGHRGVLLDAALLLQYEQFVTSAADCTVAFWGLEKNNYFQMLKQWDVTKPAVTIKNAGTSLLLANTEGRIVCFSLDRNEAKFSLDEHTDLVLTMLCVSQNIIISGSVDNTIKIWDTLEGSLIQTLESHSNAVQYLSHSKTMNYVISGGGDDFLLVWSEPMLCDINQQSLIKQLFLKSPCVGIECVNSDLICCDKNSIFWVWNLKTFQILQKFCEGIGPNNPLVHGNSPDPFGQGKKLGSSITHNVTDFTLVPKDEHRKIISQPQDNHSSRQKKHRKGCGNTSHNTNKHISVNLIVSNNLLLRFNRVNRRNLNQECTSIVFAHYNPVSITIIVSTRTIMKIYNALTGEIIHEFKSSYADPITCGCFDTRYRRIIVGDHQGRTQIFNYANGAPMNELDKINSQEISGVVYSSKQYIITTSWGGYVTLHRDPGEKDDESTLIWKKRDHSSDVTCVCISEELSICATGSVKGDIVVYPLVELNNQFGKFKEDAHMITSLEFCNGYLLVANDSNKIILFEISVRLASKKLMQWNCKSTFLCMKSINIMTKNNDNNFLKFWCGQDNGTITLTQIEIKKHETNNEYNYTELKEKRLHDCIVDLEVINNGNGYTLMTFGRVDLLKLWNTETLEKIGGINDDQNHHEKEWNFHINIRKHRYEMLAETKQLIKDTECMEKASKFFLTEKDYPIEHIGFVKEQKYSETFEKEEQKTIKNLNTSQSCPHIIRRNQSKTHLFPKNNGLVHGKNLSVGNLRHSLTLNTTQQDAAAKLEVAFARANLLNNNKKKKKKEIRKSKSTPYFRLNLYGSTDSNENEIEN